MQMLPQPVFSPTFVCITIIITIFSIFLLLPPSYSDPLDGFIECYRSTSFICGSHGTFYYPFWNYSTPEHCRSLGFHLTNCEQAVPTIDFGPGGSFRLLNANLSNYTLTIAPTDLEAYICPETPQYKTVSHPFLKLFETNKNLTLFFNCTPPAEQFQLERIAVCEPKYNNKPFSMNDSELESDDHYRSQYKCGTVKIAVDQTVFNNVQESKMRLFDALGQYGFDVEFNIRAVLCDQCESLGGTCEYSSSSVQYPKTTCQRHQGPGRRSFALRNIILVTVIAAGIGVLLAFIITIVFKRIKRMVIFRKVITKSDQSIEAFIRDYGTLAPKKEDITYQIITAEGMARQTNSRTPWIDFMLIGTRVFAQEGEYAMYSPRRMTLSQFAMQIDDAAPTLPSPDLNTKTQQRGIWTKRQATQLMIMGVTKLCV